MLSGWQHAIDNKHPIDYESFSNSKFDCLNELGIVAKPPKQKNSMVLKLTFVFAMGNG